MTVLLASLQPLIDALTGQGYTVIGPTQRGEAIELAPLRSAADLPHGWGVHTDAGQYRLRRRGDQAAFGHSGGPQAWKRFLHPPRETLVELHRDGDDLVAAPAPAPQLRYAFLGVRPCDLRAIGVQDRVLGASPRYAQRRAALFLITVDCTEPASTCFCVSAGGGPSARDGFDLALTELAPPGAQPTYLAAAGSDAGAALLELLPQQPAPAELVAAAAAAVEAAATSMPRRLPDVDLRAMLAAAGEADRWEQVANRCLACGNCTMACPTCFCTSVHDSTDLTGAHAQRWQEWASCFELDYSYLHGGPVRASTRSRYRQWLTHKLGTWHDQFGESGCVGCGRCIIWCPVGIDITEEATMLATELNGSR
jgi:ferredoxin